MMTAMVAAASITTAGIITATETSVLLIIVSHMLCFVGQFVPIQMPEMWHHPYFPPLFKGRLFMRKT